MSSEKQASRTFKEILRTKFENTNWFKLAIIIVLLTAPHFLKSFFPIPAQAQTNEFWGVTSNVPSSNPWVYTLILLIRGIILIFLVWAVVRLITSEE